MTMGQDLRAWLPAGGFGEALYVFDAVDSTNTTAAALAQDGAVEGTLVVADHQRRGRGRGGSSWSTPAGTAIALSLVLRPPVNHPLRWMGLGAVAVVEGLREEGLSAWIKWPNDVLLEGRKVAGVLAEAAWQGDLLSHLVLGIGVNVRSGSVPQQDPAYLATCVDAHAERAVERSALIANIVGSLTAWYSKMESARFLQFWEDRLAHKGERVRVEWGEEIREGRLLGLGPEGEARLLLDDGREFRCDGGARSLRPVGSGG